MTALLPCLPGVARGLAAACLAALSVPPLHAQPRAEPPPGDYRVVGGKVDRGTFTGWRVFHTACYGCHGVDAVGTDLAPNLVERVKTMTPRAFATKAMLNKSSRVWALWFGMGCKAQTTAIAQLWRGFSTPQTAQNRADRAARDLFSVALKC